MPENYATDISVLQMVYDRLPFVAVSDDNKTILSRMIYEVMAELELCFQIASQVEPADTTRIGKEEYYSIAQRSVVADITASYVIMKDIAGTNGGTAGTPAALTFIKKAKAGSAEVEYDQYDVKKGSAGISLSGLMDAYKNSAMRRARNLGCIIDICADCTVAIDSMYGTGTSFVVVRDCNCC